MTLADLLIETDAQALPQAAITFAQAGVPVFPCWPGAKNPMVAHGLKEASSDERTVDGWWRRWPNANIGIPTGTVSGFDVVDIDVKGERPRGYASFERANRRGLLDGWAVRVLTPSGGLHLYFPVDPGRAQRSWQAARPQVDFRGDGGYILAPPSAIAAGEQPSRYRVLESSQRALKPIDAHRLRDFLDPRPVRRLRAQDAPPESLQARAERLAGWMSTRLEGERNQGLFWATCRLAEAGAQPGVALSLLGPVAEAIGLSPREIETTILSAYRTIFSEPPRVTPPTSSGGAALRAVVRGGLA